MSGSFDPRDGDWGWSLGHFDFVNTVFGVGQTTFSGELSGGTAAQNGSFTGLFTGPNAQELMARWSFPHHFSGSGADTVYSGIWVGKKN